MLHYEQLLLSVALTRLGKEGGGGRGEGGGGRREGGGGRREGRKGRVSE